MPKTNTLEKHQQECNMNTFVNMKKKLILASGSSIRATLLKNSGIEFTTNPADIDEDKVRLDYFKENATGTISNLAELLAIKKAKHISSQDKTSYVIGADQILALDNQVYSKPKSKEEALENLSKFSGKTHQLHTAVCVVSTEQTLWVYSEIVDMKVRNLSNEFIEKYINTMGDDVCKSVGAYRLEDLGVHLFSEINGNYFTILGLPILPLLNFLRNEGIIEE